MPSSMLYNFEKNIDCLAFKPWNLCKEVLFVSRNISICLHIILLVKYNFLERYLIDSLYVYSFTSWVLSKKLVEGPLYPPEEDPQCTIKFYHKLKF